MSVPQPLKRLRLRREGLPAQRDRSRFRSSRTTLVGLVCCLAGLLMVFPASAPAFAHATVISTSPAADQSFSTSPSSVSLSFSEAVSIGRTPVALSTPAGANQPLGPARLSQHATLLTVAVRDRLPAGVYTVNWKVTSLDGDVVGGSYRFGVGGPTITGQLDGGQQLSNPGFWPTSLLRWLLFGAFAISFGGIAGSVLTHRRGTDISTSAVPWVLPAAAAGMIATAGLAALNVGSGDLFYGLNHLSVAQLLKGREGTLVGIEFLAFVAAVIPAALRRPVYAAAPLFLVAVAEGLRGHPETIAGGWGALLVTIHLSAAAVWVGGLAHVLRAVAAWRGDRQLVWLTLRDYSRWALWLFIVVLASGVTAGLIVTPLSEIPTTAYGRSLLAKIVLVLLAAAIAHMARRRLADRSSVAAVVARARVESVALVAVLAVTGVLVSLAPPRLSEASLAFAPPLNGPVVAVGGRTGQIGVLVQAARDRLNVTLAGPELGNSLDPEQSSESQSYRLSGAMQAPHGGNQTTPFTGCGTGCFTAPTQLAAGLDQLTLHVQAAGWTGGTITLTLPWPPHPQPATLTKTVAAMRVVTSFTLFERVTSDTTMGLGKKRRFTLSGRRFIATEPYDQAKASTTSSYITPAGTVLNLAYPADRITVQLTLDATNRIIQETLNTPDEMVTRSFAYPEHG